MTCLSITGWQLRDLIAMVDASAERTEVFAEVCENLEKPIGFNGAVLAPHEATAAAHPLPTGHLILNKSNKSTRESFMTVPTSKEGEKS